MEYHIGLISFRNAIVLRFTIRGTGRMQRGASVTHGNCGHPADRQDEPDDSIRT